MTEVFDFQDFMRARFAQDRERIKNLRMLKHVDASEKIMELHQPMLATWHPTWFCSCCEGNDEPEHDPGPLMKAGADWPCDTLKALAEVYSEYEDYGKWIPGIREHHSTIGKYYVLQGGPLSDGRGRVRPNEPEYLADPSWGENDSVMVVLIKDPEGMDGQPIIVVHDAGGVYVYRAATDTIEWVQRSEDPGTPIGGYQTGTIKRA